MTFRDSGMCVVSESASEATSAITTSGDIRRARVKAICA